MTKEQQRLALMWFFKIKEGKLADFKLKQAYKTYFLKELKR